MIESFETKKIKHFGNNKNFNMFIEESYKIIIEEISRCVRFFSEKELELLSRTYDVTN